MSLEIKSIFFSEILVLKIQFQDDSNCEVVEDFRKNLSQFIDAYYSEVHFMKVVDKRMFLQYQTKDVCKEDSCILNLSSGDIHNLPPGFMEDESRLYVVKHGKTDLIGLFPNQVKVLRYFGHGKFKSKLMDFDFNSYPLCDVEFISNRSSQVFMILSTFSSNEIHVFGLFDLKNRALIFQGSEDKHLQIFVNGTGEEIYIFHQNTLSVYFHHSPVKSLLSLAAAIIRIIYTENELSQMNLLGKYQYLYQSYIIFELTDFRLFYVKSLVMCNKWHKAEP